MLVFGWVTGLGLCAFVCMRASVWAGSCVGRYVWVCGQCACAWVSGLACGCGWVNRCRICVWADVCVCCWGGGCVSGCRLGQTVC